MAIQHMDCNKKKWVSLGGHFVSMKLKLMKQIHEAMRQKQKQEIDQLQATEISLEMWLATVQKKARNTKTILFNTIRESEMKLKRAVCHLLGDNKLEVKALVNTSTKEMQRNNRIA